MATKTGEAMQLGPKIQETAKVARRREQIESINRFFNPRLRWLCLLTHEEKDEQTFEHFVDALEELLAIRRKGLRLAASSGEKEGPTRAQQKA